MNEKLKEIISELVLKDATCGVNYAVIDNKTIYTGSIGLKAKYGLKEDKLIEQFEDNNINTMYDIASLTKVVCTLSIIFRLYERGLLNLNDKVQKYLKAFKYDDITIYDLLTHTSGLPADFSFKDIIPKTDAINILYTMDKINPKGTFLYSDIGYMLLGLLIEKICNKPLDKVFKEEVTDLLEMNNTCFNPKNKFLVAPTEITKERGVVRGVVHDEKAMSMEGIAGHAGVFSNIEDLIKFSQMILNNGKFKNKKYLSESTIESWYEGNVIDGTEKRSFSWFVGNNSIVIENQNAISFNGFTGPSISIDRKNNIAIILLTNRVHPTRNNTLISKMRPIISDKIYELILSNRKEKFYSENHVKKM